MLFFLLLLNQPREKWRRFRQQRGRERGKLEVCPSSPPTLWSAVPDHHDDCHYDDDDNDDDDDDEDHDDDDDNDDDDESTW